MRVVLLLFLLVLGGCQRRDQVAPARLVVWAWERPEDLRFLPKDVPVAVQTGFVEIGTDGLIARGRRFPLLLNGLPRIALVHVQIDERHPPLWTAALRRRVAAAVLHYAGSISAHEVQVDFEVRQSQRGILLDLLRDVRAGLPSDVRLSMTALASWCQEDWLDRAPVDEIVPMLFRMGRGGPTVRAQLESGSDFSEPRCRQALAISTDSPVARAPAGRRLYLFDPRSWTQADFEAVRRQTERWG